MNNFISGIVELAIGGVVLLVFGRLAVRSLWDRRTRDELLSSPYIRNPTTLHKIGFAILLAIMMAVAASFVLSGLSNLGKVFV